MELSRILNSHATPSAPKEPQPEHADAELRVGKWTEEEERFAVELIRHFLTGSIVATPGISLRSFLAKKLRCSPMRISTKLAVDTLGGERIPKRLGQKRYFPMDTVSHAERQRIAAELHELEIAFLEKENLPIEESAFVHAETPSTTNSDDEGMSGDDNAAAVRIGSWSDEEQVYAAALIDGFLRGMLDQPQGTTLRAFLAEQLCCNPMRISKKLATGMMANQALPKRLGSATFQPALSRSLHEVVRTEEELARLRSACFAPAKGPGHSSSDYNDYAPHKPLSPVAPLTKKRCYGESLPQLPSLSQACKRQMFVHTIVLN